MVAINADSAKTDFDKYCDLAINDFETIVITRSNNNNVVLLSEEEYNNMLENMYIQGNKQLCKKLDKAIEEVKKGEFIKVEI